MEMSPMMCNLDNVAEAEATEVGVEVRTDSMRLLDSWMMMMTPKTMAVHCQNSLHPEIVDEVAVAVLDNSNQILPLLKIWIPWTRMIPD